MASDMELLFARLKVVERHCRAMRFIVAALVLIGMSVAWLPQSTAQQQAKEPLRVRGLIVEDANGRPRVVIGQLDPCPSTRDIGLRINDPSGAERLALYLLNNGRAGIGLDAPPGKGDDRNRERINLAADEDGGAYIRFLDRRTSVAARMYLDEQNQVWMQFSDFTKTPPVVRRYGLSGEESVQTPR